MCDRRELQSLKRCLCGLKGVAGLLGLVGVLFLSAKPLLRWSLLTSIPYRQPSGLPWLRFSGCLNA